MNFYRLTIVILAATIFSCRNESSRRYYVLNQKVFNEFKATKEKQKEMQKIQDRQRAILDSLSLVIKSLKDGPASLEKRQLYNNLIAEFSRQNEEQTAYHSEGLWKQINQYVGDYGRENKAEFIYGADGSGAVMYADTTLDKTEEIIKYINRRYEGE